MVGLDLGVSEIGLIDDFINYEVFIFALGGDVECPEGNLGISMPFGREDAQRLACDVWPRAGPATEIASGEGLHWSDIRFPRDTSARGYVLSGALLYTDE